MLIRIGFEITLRCRAPTPLVLALLPHPSFAGRVIGTDRLRSLPEVVLKEYRDTFDNRRTRMTAPIGQLQLWTDCIVEDDGRPDSCDRSARQIAIEELTFETLSYLTASRYCESDELVDRTWDLFGHTPEGWERVQAVCDWVHNHLTFGYTFARPTKTATDTLRERTGVCRDFAQLAVAFCRAMNIPARYASGYLGDIGVPKAGAGDFCAWFEVYLQSGDGRGRWHVFDARYNTPRIGRVPMVCGRDAADVAMITSFGAYDLELFRVWTEEIEGDPSEDRCLAMLETRPRVRALTLAPTDTGPLD